MTPIRVVSESQLPFILILSYGKIVSFFAFGIGQIQICDIENHAIETYWQRPS